jgi:integrase
MPSPSIHFTARAAKLAKPGDVFLVDSASGLRLVVTESKKSWVYRHRDDQKIKQIKLGEWPSMGLGDAVAKWTELRGQRSVGVDLVDEKKKSKAQKNQNVGQFQTMRELLEDFLENFIEKERKSPSAKAARSRISKLLIEDPVFAKLHPSEVNRAVAFQILDSRKDLPTATKVLRSLLGQAVDRALDAGRVDPDVPNWWRMVLHGKLRSKGRIVDGKHVGRSKRVLSQDELRLVLPWAKAHMPPMFRDITMLYLLTGLRGGEIIGLREEYVRQESDGWWITIPANKLKMERDLDTIDHRVPLVEEALDIIQGRLVQAREGWLFWTNRGGVFRPYTQRAFSRFIYDIQPDYNSKTKVKRKDLCPAHGWSAHDLRRTARTLLASMGCPEPVSEAIVGHKPQNHMVSTYNLHSYDKEKRYWLAQLFSKLKELGV